MDGSGSVIRLAINNNLSLQNIIGTKKQESVSKRLREDILMSGKFHCDFKEKYDCDAIVCSQWRSFSLDSFDVIAKGFESPFAALVISVDVISCVALWP